MLIGEIARRLHDCKLNPSVGVVQTESRISRAVSEFVYSRKRRSKPILRLWRFQNASEQRDSCWKSFSELYLNNKVTSKQQKFGVKSRSREVGQ
jgi:hypothetical protein